MGQQPQTRREARAAQQGRTWVVPTVVGVIAAAVLGGAVWFGSGLLSSPSASGNPSAVAGAGPSSPSDSTPMTMPMTTPAPSAASPEAAATSGTEGAAQPPAPTTTPDALTAAVAACRTAWRAETTARNDAYLALGQWDRHLAIMDALQAGRITLAKAMADWPATTKQAKENVAAFRATDRARAGSTARCAVPAGATDQPAVALRQCAASLRTIDGVLDRARTAIAPWETHLQDQSHFMAGDVTPTAAELAWRALWQKGRATMPAYRAVAGQGQQASCTLPA
ncbi:MAG: hypothetical protein JWP82_2838 [Humibacillus sp.]|nr:hypothetical protein [Humibacillus sp.]